MQVEEQKKPYVIEGAGGGKGGGGGRAPIEADNTLSSSAVVRLIDLVSEGEIVGLSTGDGKSIYFDDTPILNADGTVNFENVDYDIRFGLPSQTYIEGFSAVETPRTVGVSVVAATPVVRSVANGNVDAARVTIQLPQGLSTQDTKTGDLLGGEVQIAIDVKLTASGTWTNRGTWTIKGKTMSVYEKSYRVERPSGSGVWDIRVRRITADSTSSGTRNATTFARFDEIVDEKLSYDDSAYIGLKVDAESTGGQYPVRSYVLKGIKIKYPSNYNPTAHTYSGQWNGAFVTGWCNNPAWVLYDLLTNSRYGVDFSEDMIDKFSFYDAGVYCDGLVSDGNGGQEPRFTFNGVIQARDDAIKVCQAIASTMRSSISWYGGLLRINQDRPGDPVQYVTKADVIDGKFTYQSSALMQRNTVAQVTFQDKTDKWSPRIITYENTNGVNIYGYNPVEVFAFGCTSPGQAHRLGTWSIYTNLNQRENVSWKSSFKQMTLILGDIVTIHDDDYGVERNFRIMSIKLEEANIVAYEAVLYDAAKYQFVDLTDNSSPPIFGPPAGSTVGIPYDITWTPFEVNFEGNITYRLQLEWRPPTTGNPTRYNVKWRKDNGNFESVDVTTPSYSIENVTPGVFEARITAYNSQGVFSPVAQSTYTYTLNSGTPGGPTGPIGSSSIGTPTNLQIKGGGTAWTTEDMSFEWKAPNPIGNNGFTGSLKDFEVKLFRQSDNALLRTVYVDAVAAGATQSFTYTMAMNRTDTGGPNRVIKVEVRCRDAKNLTGAAAIATFNNAAPAGITNAQVVASLKGFFFTLTLPTEPDFAGIYVWGSTNANFTLGQSTLLIDGNENFLVWEPVGGTKPNTNYYFKMAAYDRFSKPVDGAGLTIINLGATMSSYEVMVTTGSVLPTTGNYEGRLFYLTTDGKLYRYHNGAWTAAVPAVDIIGTLTSTQLGDIAAALATGSITTTKIADNAISTPKLMAGAVSTAKLAAGAVVADTIAANAITGIKIASDSITSDKIAANAITSDKIMANAITVGKLDSGIITSDKMYVNNGVFDICVSNKFFVDEAHIRDASVSTLKIQDQAVTVPIGYTDSSYRTMSSGFTDIWGAWISNTSNAQLRAQLSAVIEYSPGTSNNVAGVLQTRIVVNGGVQGDGRTLGFVMNMPYANLPIIENILIPSGNSYIIIQALEQSSGTITSYGHTTRVACHVLGVKK